MIYADFVEEPDFDRLVMSLKEHFGSIEYGQQGDAWIWITQNEMKVAIDTFTTMHFQVKAEPASEALAESVLAALQGKFEISILAEPELEPHEY